MRLLVRHSTLYRFDGPVTHGFQRLRLTPKETQGQKILNWTMQFDGAHEQTVYEDQHHNTVTLIASEEGAREVRIVCEGEVDTSDHAGVLGEHSGHMPLWSFRGVTPLTKPGPKLRGLARDMAQAHRGTDGALSGTATLKLLHDLSARIRDDVPYTIGQTSATTTAEEALDAGLGVCQDHAQIFIGAARLLDIPARYVSGYLMMDDRIEQEATHAWAEAYVEGLGWTGFDVSNGISPDSRYIRVATGCDYHDAAPVTGISFGAGEEQLEVAVAVEQRPDQKARQQSDHYSSHMGSQQ
jgi:transglutaminase-like putative cysteine protease